MAKLRPGCERLYIGLSEEKMSTSTADSMEIIQKFVLETLEKDSLIPDTRVVGAEFTQQQVLGVLMRLESHQVKEGELN